MSDFKREIILRPAWDKRNSDPAKNYGQHCVDLVFYLHGKKGVIQFVLFTGWFLKKEPGRAAQDAKIFPMPVDLGYHAKEPQYEGQGTMSCDLLGTCYYDGSGLQAEEVYQILLNEGSEGVWRRLEEEYEYRFGEKEG